MQGYKVYTDLSCTVPPAFRMAVSGTVMVTWVSLIVYAVVQGAVATAAYVRVHWQEMDPRLLSLSHLVWFAWGCLLLSGLLPSLAYGIAYMLMLPFKVRLQPHTLHCYTTMPCADPRAPVSYVMLTNRLDPQLFPNPKSRCRRAWRFLVVSVVYNLEKVTVAALVLSLVFAPTFPNAITAAWLAIIVRYEY